MILDLSWRIEFAQLSTWRYPQLADPDVVLRAALQISRTATDLLRTTGRHRSPIATLDSFSSAAEIRDLARQASWGHAMTNADMERPEWLGEPDRCACREQSRLDQSGCASGQESGHGPLLC